MRISFAVLVLAGLRDQHPYAFTEQQRPVGIARLLNLTWLHHDGMYQGILGLAAVCCILYALGIGLQRGVGGQLRCVQYAA